MKFTVPVACLLAGAVITAQQAQTPPAAPPPSPTGYQDTPMQPNGKWHIHDGTRPQPPCDTGPARVAGAPIGRHRAAREWPGSRRWQMTQGGGPVSWPVESGVCRAARG